MDNASNNQTFMECLERLLAERAIIDFCAKNNYIRCFSHIVNLCSQACIKAMEADDDTSTQYPDTDTDSATETDTPATQPTRPVRKTRKSGPICRARKTVAYIRKSGQRRDLLLEIIEDGNTTSLWTTRNDQNVQISTTLVPVTVLPDVRTRWDSVFYMLRRLCYLQQVRI
jgi:hypothetical protein